MITCSRVAAIRMRAFIDSSFITLQSFSPLSRVTYLWSIILRPRTEVCDHTVTRVAWHVCITTTSYSFCNKRQGDGVSLSYIKRRSKIPPDPTNCLPQTWRPWRRITSTATPLCLPVYYATEVSCHVNSYFQRSHVALTQMAVD